MRTRAERYGWCCVWLALAAVGCGGGDASTGHAIQAPTSLPAAGTAGTTGTTGDSGTGASAAQVAGATGTARAGAAAAGSAALAGSPSPPASGAGVAGKSASASGAAGKPASTTTDAGNAATGAAGAAANSGATGGTTAGTSVTMPAVGGTVPTLFFLNVAGGVLRASPDGTDRKQIVASASAGTGPDGIAVDVAGGHVYWTDMGAVSSDDGTVMRADLDGRSVTTIVKAGGTFTPKQLKIDTQHGKLYWSDREGMRVMRANLDGSKLENLVVTGSSEADRRDASHWCVGIALDVAAGKLYWSQKGGDNAHQGTIKRAGLELPTGQDPAQRDDIEVLWQGLPEPIDLDIDLDKRLLYWTDRGDNTVSRAPLDLPAGANPSARSDREILVKGLGEAIGIGLDASRNRMFYTSIAGVVGGAALDGSMAHDVLTNQGSLTGIALVELPK